MKWIKLAVMVALLVVGVHALADTTIRTAEQFELAEDAVVTGNFFGSGNPVTLSGEVSEDALLFGNRVTITGLVQGDVLASGIFVTHAGVVQSDVKVAAGEVTISGVVEGDVFVTAGTVDITSEAQIGGDVVIYAGAVSIAGSVAGDVIGSMSELYLNGSVSGGVDVAVNQLDLGQNASITQAVRYESTNLLTQNLNTVITGETIRTDPQSVVETSFIPVPLVILMVLLFATLVWVFLSVKTLRHVIVGVVAHPWRSVLIGWAAVVTGPIAVAVLFASVLGAFVGVLLLFVYITVFLLALVATPVMLGRALVQLTALAAVHPTSLTVVGIGMAATVGLVFVPYVGPFVLVVAVVCTFGGLLEALVRVIR